MRKVQSSLSLQVALNMLFDLKYKIFKATCEKNEDVVMYNWYYAQTYLSSHDVRMKKVLHFMIKMKMWACVTIQSKTQQNKKGNWRQTH